ncbi:MAG: hypothetical protein JWN15_3797, partial [Firmicutes bacterium]|nr:hypothetical protein [Bacillota bacterium]
SPPPPASRLRSMRIVTHGGTIQCLYRLALGLPVNTPHSVWNGDTSVHEWLVDASGALSIVMANCTRHLQGER